MGTYTLTAVATDSQGAQSTSSPRTFTVSDTNTPPTVSLVIPQDNSKWNAPATVTFQASVSSGEANDTVSVEFFANGASLGTRTSAPWSLSTSLAANTYTITAVATDGQGAQTTSVARTISVSDTNLAPTISISSPSGGANYPAAPAGFTFSATAGAGEVNGWVTKVEFYVNGNLVNTDTAGPFSTSVSGLANGTYTLTAKAFDQLNASTTSAPVTISVGPQSKLYFIEVDHLNTPRAIFDDQQQLRWKWEQTEAFGDSVPEENPSGLGAFEFPARFPGQYADRETGLSYNYFRDYDASLGIYKQSDPVGLQGGLDTYAYTADNPLSFFDPEGLQGRAPGRGPVGAQTQNISVCSYYDGIATKYGCRYHAFAAKVCRGDVSSVNILGAACLLSTIQLNCLRSCLVEADQFWRSFPACQVTSAANCPPGKNCTKLSCINDYHAGCFSKCGAGSPACYGGNWPIVGRFPNDGD